MVGKRGGMVVPYFLHISSSWVKIEIRLHAETHIIMKNFHLVTIFFTPAWGGSGDPNFFNIFLLLG